MEVFNQFHPIPYTKMLTFYRSEPFQLEAVYNSTDSALLNPEIGFVFSFFVLRHIQAQLLGSFIFRLSTLEFEKYRLYNNTDVLC